MQKIFFSLPLLLLGNLIPSCYLQTNHSIQQQVATSNGENQTLIEQVIISQEVKGADVISDLLNINISKNSLVNLKQNPSSIEQFVNNLRYNPNGEGTAFSQAGYLPKLKNSLIWTLQEQVSNVLDTSSKDGAVIDFYTNFTIKETSLATAIIDINPYIDYNPSSATGNYDGVEKYYQFLAPDTLKVDISQQAWKWINSSGSNAQYYSLISALFKDFPQYDHSGAGGSITGDNIHLLANIFIKCQSGVQKYFNQSTTKGVVITTTTDGSEATVGYE